MKRLSLAAIAALAVICLPSQVSAEPISVSLTNGKQLTVVVSSRTDRTWLCLETNSTSTRLIRRVRWQQVKSASLDGKAIEVAALRAELLKRAPQPKKRSFLSLPFELPKISGLIADMARSALGLVTK